MYCHEFDEEEMKLIFQELLQRLANKINKITQVTIRYPTNTLEPETIVYFNRIDYFQFCSVFPCQ